ncbi:hypothetical protein [Chitinilyticum piscinae]|uniref:Uncharacterized protein n=1 Tax=Chitinilyticum piscinae TaxID=2866724 RepID=A0A8J7FEW2_9NEIS|nr:hypothetical protein [Chitinilyticum piscinae]MBE9608133.1 hypothetical protein [Chitinilyticum piscinae]
MRYAIHPVWATTVRPEELRYGLYAVGPQGEQELVSSASLDVIETAREALLRVLQQREPQGWGGPA